ncbi:MAG: hypothetical protein B0D92_08555 [Spirochaeta sp. LUC14_002_19_P3]|nr:MAG: hypothetical protein B0D92_08555 [Spirochaeta sp. LUC14_002_19_P3]
MRTEQNRTEQNRTEQQYCSVILSLSSKTYKNSRLGTGEKSEKKRFYATLSKQKSTKFPSIYKCEFYPFHLSNLPAGGGTFSRNNALIFSEKRMEFTSKKVCEFHRYSISKKIQCYWLLYTGIPVNPPAREFTGMPKFFL